MYGDEVTIERCTEQPQDDSLFCAKHQLIATDVIENVCIVAESTPEELRAFYLNYGERSFDKLSEYQRAHILTPKQNYAHGYAQALLDQRKGAEY